MITDLASLQAAVISTLNRPDIAAEVPGLIQLGDNRLRTDPRVSHWMPDLEPLGGDVTVTELLAEEPMLYLYAALAESAPFLKDDPRLVIWEGALDTRLTNFHTSRWLKDYESQETLIPNRKPSFGA